MIDLLLLLLTCALAALGFGLIAVSQAQHRPLAPRVVARMPLIGLRVAGALFIALSAATAVLRDGLTFGLLLWATMLTIPALLVVAWLSNSKHKGP